MNFSPKNPKTKIIPNGFRGIFFGSIFLAALVSVGFFALSNVQAATGINEQISFQGKVVNSDGTNVTDGSYTFLFCLYTTGSPSSNCTTGSNNDAVWRESKSVTVTDGIFQTNLGDTTTLPGSVDFNTDNIYLGINFDADGQMSPLVRFTAAPYAMNAARVGGLTVTDTTGTLTIPNSETISFGGSFTTSASNDVTLTTTGATNVTLPTTGTLVTLDGVETLTNKTIGSTGLTFSGATTDITTASGEALTLNSGTTGTINIGTDASAETINIGNTGAAVKTIAIGNNTQANTITIGDASVTGLSLTDNNWSISTAGAAAFASLSSSGAIAANGGITFDASTDTVGAFTAAGTIDMSTNILTNIGNTGTDFVASTGALTLAGVLTANGGISLSGSQSLAAAALSYIDLGLITHSSTANQGLRLPNAASASPSNPTSGEGYLAWDAAGNQLITYNGSAWTTVGGTSTLDGAYTAGNTITTDSGSNVSITLQEVVTPTSFVIENQDTAGVNAQRIFSSIASGTLTNGILIEQTGAGTLTNGIQIAETAGTITDGILITGTLGNILNSGSIDITGAGAITGATGFNGLVVTANTGVVTTGTWNATAIGAQYGGTGINTSSSTGVPVVSSGTWSVASQLGVAQGGTNATTIGSAGSIAYSTGTAYAFSGVGTAGQAIVSGGTGVPTFFAPTAGSIVFAGTSGVLSQDNTSFFWDDSSNELGIGTATPGAMLDIYGTSNALRLSYDGSNYGTLSTASDGTLSFASSNVTESQFTIGTGASVDDSVAFDGASQDYYAGLDHTTGYFTIGSGFTVGSSTLFAIDSTGNVGIGTGVTAPGARLEILSTSPQLLLSYTDGSIDGTISVNASETLSLQAGTTSETKIVQIGAGGVGSTTPDYFALDVKSDTGDPVGGFEGAMYYNTFDNKFRCYQGSAWADCIGSGGGTTWDTIGDAAGNGAIAMSETVQTLDWNTAATASAFDGLTLTLTNDATTDSATQRALVVANQDDAGSTGTTEAIMQIVNRDSNEVVGSGLVIENSGAGTMTSALEILETAGAITTGIVIGNNIGTGLSIGTGVTTGISIASGGIVATGEIIFTNTGGTASLTVNDQASDTTPFVIDTDGKVGIGTSAPARALDIIEAASSPQLRLSKDLTNYSEMTVDSAGDLLVGATGSDIRALSENVWVCDNDACPALTLTGDGNIFVENVIKFGNGVYMKNDSATELGVYDNDDQAMLIFDEL